MEEIRLNRMPPSRMPYLVALSKSRDLGRLAPLPILNLSHHCLLLGNEHHRPL